MSSKRYHIKCAHCGRSAIKKSRFAKYCSDKCCNAASMDRWIKRNGPFICAYCGEEFKPKVTDRTTYCSRECAYADKAAKPKSSKVYFPVCSACGEQFTARTKSAHLCSDECRAQYASRLNFENNRTKWDGVVHRCAICGTEYQPEYGRETPRTTCSKKCQRELYRRHDKAAKARREARLRGNDGVAIETIDPIMVFMRDGWICQLCGKRVLKNKRGTYHPLAPELDHIVPLSRGGSHTWDNVQCSCRECNGNKGSNILGQTRLALVYPGA